MPKGFIEEIELRGESSVMHGDSTKTTVIKLVIPRWHKEFKVGTVVDCEVSQPGIGTMAIGSTFVVK